MNKYKYPQKFKGCKVLVKIDCGDESVNYEDSFNIATNFKSFSDDVNRPEYTSIDLLEDNLTLYKCDILKTNQPSIILEKRKRWAKKDFDYRDFYTKDEIINLLKNDYLVAVQGLQEIELEDIDKLD